MAAIGIDTHKATLAACAIDELGKPVAEATFANDPGGHVAFIAWARSTAPGATIGVEGSSSFGGTAGAVGSTRRPERPRGAAPPESGGAPEDASTRQERSR